MDPYALDGDAIAIKSVAEAGFEVVATPGMAHTNASTIPKSEPCGRLPMPPSTDLLSRHEDAEQQSSHWSPWLAPAISVIPV